MAGRPDTRDSGTAPSLPVPLAAPALDGLPHGFFTRQGGVSTGIYATLNGGPGSGDDPAAVGANRAAIAAALGVSALVSVMQVHSAIVHRPTAPWPPGARPEGDAMVTATPGIGLAVLAADCAPVLFADRRAGVIGAAHAGWRGALGGVLEATLGAMADLGATPAGTVAVIGPCISQRAYEVGPEFVERFLDEDPESRRCFTAGRPHAEGRRAQFDLPGYALARLRAAGVGTATWCGHCSYGDEARFFSYRRATHRGEPDYGRLVSAIALPPVP